MVPNSWFQAGFSHSHTENEKQPALLVCLGLRDLPGHGTLSFKTERVSGKPDELVTPEGHGPSPKDTFWTSYNMFFHLTSHRCSLSTQL